MPFDPSHKLSLILEKGEWDLGRILNISEKKSGGWIEFLRSFWIGLRSI